MGSQNAVVEKYLKRISLLIDGEFVDGKGASIEVVNPSEGDAVLSYNEATPSQIDDAVASARRAFTSWRHLTPRKRAEALLAIADAIDAECDTLSYLESLNCGKPLRNSRLDEIPRAADVFRFFAGAIRTSTEMLADEYIADSLSFCRREPIGVVAAIIPWNYPLLMMAWKVAPILASGNTVVLKPSEEAPLSVMYAARAFAELLPAGVCNVLPGTGETVGAALSRHPGIDLVSVTGDSSTGRKVLAAGADTLKRSYLEMGGNAPVIVHRSADIQRVTAGLRRASFYNAGQDCTAAARVYVDKEIYDELVDSLVCAVRDIRVGSALAYETELGPLISRRQLDRVASFVERAKALPHVSLATGGSVTQDQGFFFSPTVFADMAPDDELVLSEVFGPVVTVTRCADFDEAIGLANKSVFGLTSSVWTTDLSTGLRAGAELEYGCVWVNEHMSFPAEMPHGGRRQSGFGYDMSIHSLQQYSVLKHVMMKI